MDSDEVAHLTYMLSQFIPGFVFQRVSQGKGKGKVKFKGKAKAGAWPPDSCKT